MYEYDDEVLDTFLKKQTQLFSEEVADTPEAAEEFLEDCMAVVCKNIKEVRDYFDEAGSDISGMSDDELLAHSVCALLALYKDFLYMDNSCILITHLCINALR